MMKRQPLRLSTLVLPLALLATAAVQAAPIEGGTEKALSDNSQLLKSVIKLDMGIFFEAGTCTSTLISKNILLTARHCVDSLKAGDRVKLNDNNTYQVADVVAQKDMYAQTPTDLVSTDVALVLFNATDCSKSNLKDIKPLALASQANKSTLTNRVLIAGYGETRFGLGDAGILHAGYNEWVLSDYSSVADPALVPVLQQILRKTKTADNQLVMQGQRADITWFENKKGQAFSEKPFAASQIKADSAVDLPGDSGGPAIAQDAQGNSFIVGVTSTIMPNVDGAPGKLVIADGNHKKIGELPLADTENAMADALRTLMGILIESKAIDSNLKVLVDFSIAYIKPRIALGTYVSTSNPLNDTFIRENLNRFEKTRDDAKNFCQ